MSEAGYGPRVHLSGAACMPSCRLQVQKSDFHLINVFCTVIVVKNVLCLAQVAFLFCTAQQQDTFGAYDQKLHICATCCSDSKMGLIVKLEESILGIVPRQ